MEMPIAAMGSLMLASLEARRRVRCKAGPVSMGFENPRGPGRRRRRRHRQPLVLADARLTVGTTDQKGGDAVLSFNRTHASARA